MEKIKVLFLDIDGVCNCLHTRQRSRGFIGIDPYMAFMVGKIVLDTGCKVVLSSSWRHFDGGVEEVKAQVCDLLDVTGTEPHDDNLPPGAANMQRGREIKAWLDKHPEVERYAIVDDENDMLPEQQKNFFKTTWNTGITESVAKEITEHLK